MELLSERSGIRFEYINGYTWDELIEMFSLGQIDLVHSLSLTPERQDKSYFPPHTITVKMSLFCAMMLRIRMT